VAAPTDIISLDEAKDFLNIDNDISDFEISGFITSASLAWVNRVGPVAGATTYDEWYDGGGSTIVLRHTPVTSVTSITEAYTDSLTYTLTADPLDGTGVSGFYGYTLEKERGLLVRRANGTSLAFAKGVRNVHIVYVAGYTTAPEDIKEAVKALLKQGWETQRGGSRRPGSEPAPQGYMGLWPSRAQDIANSYLVPGIA
jgi:hypothetical protein